MIYLDNAATTLHKPQTVIDAVTKAMSSMGNASRGAHSGALSASRAVYEARVKIARLFNCPKPEQVVFTANSTEALNTAIRGIFSPGDHVITTELEHNSVLRPLYYLQSEGIIELSFVQSDKMGRPDYSQFESLIRKNTRGIVCTHASNLTGNMVDLEQVGRICRQHGLLLIADASQTAGSVPIDMEKMGVDVLCFTGHKGLMGPQGTGGLCIGNGIEIRPFKFGGSGIHSYEEGQPQSYPERLEAGTLNSHGIAGLSAAVDYLELVGIQQIRRKELELMERFYQDVSQIPQVKVYGDFAGERTAVVTLNIGGMDSGRAADILFEDYDIAVRAGAHCAPRMHRALGTEHQGAVRFSFSWFNTGEEVDTAVGAVREIAEDLI